MGHKIKISENLNSVSVQTTQRLTMAEEATLTYFDARGLAEVIRITLCFAKIPVIWSINL